MKKILPILLAMLAALAAQAPAFADGKLTEIEPLAVTDQPEDDTPVLTNDSNQGITYTLNQDNTATVSKADTSINGEISIPAHVKSGDTTYTVTSIGESAFGGCENLTSVTIPDTVTSIGDLSFQNCTSLTNIVLQDGLAKIGSRAFAHCSSLTKITIPNTVTSIEACAFLSCSQLTSIAIPNSVTTISKYAFECCTALTNIVIGSGVDTIDEGAFSSCNQLENVTFEGTEPPEICSTVFSSCDYLTTIWLSEDLTPDQRAAWETALRGAMPTDCKIVYTDLSPGPTPTTPTTPTTPETSGEQIASAPTVQQMESAERPDPQDVEATERYNFWMGVKADLRAAADGKTLRIHVPADYTNMPASVMEQIRLLDADVTVDLRWSGERLTITPATAQRKTALKAFWTFSQLCELYAQ